MALSEKNKPWFANVPNNGTVQLTSSTGVATLGSITNMQTLVTSAGDGTIVDSILVNSTDTADKFLYLAIIEGSTCKSLYGFPVPLGSGDSASVVTADALSSVNAPGLPIDGNGKRYIKLEPSQTLAVGVKAALTSAKIITITAMGADYES